MVQFGVGSRPGSCTGFGRSVGRFGLVSGLGSGRFWAEVVLVHLFGVFRGFGVFGGTAFFGFCGAPPHRELCAGNYNVRAVYALASSRGK